jgi:hypothetical protein
VGWQEKIEKREKSRRAKGIVAILNIVAFLLLFAVGSILLIAIFNILWLLVALELYLLLHRTTPR